MGGKLHRALLPLGLMDLPDDGTPRHQHQRHLFRRYICSQCLNAGGRPQDSAWLTMDDEVVAVGDAANAFLEVNSRTRRRC